jgi:DNA recombination protein RmuC
MEPSTTLIIAIVTAIIAVVCVVLLIRVIPRSDGRTPQLDAELSVLRETRSHLERRLAVEEEKASRLPALEAEAANLRDGKAAAERDLATKAETVLQVELTMQDLRRRLEIAEAGRTEVSVRLDTMKEEKADLERVSAEKAAYLEEKTATLEKARADLSETTAALNAAQQEIATLRTREARLQETLDQEQRHAEAKLTLLHDAKDQMSKEFKLLAEEVMKNHGDTFSKQNREQIEVLLSPLRDRLVEFQQGLQTAHTETAKERAALAEQIRNLTSESARMTSETSNLTQALKGRGQIQGIWGEMVLVTILEHSGLRKGEEYVTQESHSLEDGGRLRPDVVVNLPGGQRIVVDSKVSLTAFEAFASADTDVARAVHLKAHVNSLRGHIKALSSKEYHTLTADGLDYVIMFVPIEGALAAALQEEPALTAYAAENNVAIATPTTLMIALRTVANVWQVERRNRNAEEIAARAGRVYDKFVGFVEDMSDLGTRLKKATDSYEGAMGKLSTGRGNILSQIEQLKVMGAKASKALPKPLLGEDEPEISPEITAPN